jgi:hypothetical protein
MYQLSVARWDANLPINVYNEFRNTWTNNLVGYCYYSAFAILLSFQSELGAVRLETTLAVIQVFAIGSSSYVSLIALVS